MNEFMHGWENEHEWVQLSKLIPKSINQGLINHQTFSFLNRNHAYEWTSKIHAYSMVRNPFPDLIIPGDLDNSEEAGCTNRSDFGRRINDIAFLNSTSNSIMIRMHALHNSNTRHHSQHSTPAHTPPPAGQKSGSASSEKVIIKENRMHLVYFNKNRSWRGGKNSFCRSQEKYLCSLTTQAS